MGNAISYYDYYNTSSAYFHTQREYLAHYARHRYHWLQRYWHAQRNWSLFQQAHQQHAQSLYNISPTAAAAPLQHRSLHYPVLTHSPFGYQGYTSNNTGRLADLACPPGYYPAYYSPW